MVGKIKGLTLKRDSVTLQMCSCGNQSNILYPQDLIQLPTKCWKAIKECWKVREECWKALKGWDIFGCRGKSAVPEGGCLLLYPLGRGRKAMSGWKAPFPPLGLRQPPDYFRHQTPLLLAYKKSANVTNTFTFAPFPLSIETCKFIFSWIIIEVGTCFHI